jgi:hypothetical protein
VVGGGDGDVIPGGRGAGGVERLPRARHQLDCVERVGGVARDAGRHGERVAHRAPPQRFAHPFGDQHRAGFRGVGQDGDRGDVAETEHRVGFAQRAPRDGPEHRHRLVAGLLRCVAQLVDLPEHDRHGQHLAPGRCDSLLEHDG